MLKGLSSTIGPSQRSCAKSITWILSTRLWGKAYPENTIARRRWS